MQRNDDLIDCLKYWIVSTDWGPQQGNIADIDYKHEHHAYTAEIDQFDSLIRYFFFFVNLTFLFIHLFFC